MNLRKTLTVLLSIACVAVYVIGFLLYERNKAHNESAELVKQSHQVIIQAQNLYTSIERMVALQRGYLLNQSREFYTSYFEATAYIQNEYETLQKLTENNLPQQLRLLAIEHDIRSLRDLLEAKIQKRHDNPFSTRGILTDTNKIRILADEVRLLVNDFVSAEQKILTLRQQQARDHELVYFYALLAISILSVFVLVIANGMILFLTTQHRHVTATLSQSEKELFKMRERFELAVRGTQDGIFDWQSETDELYFSPRIGQMLGYEDMDEFPKTSEKFRRLLHPDDVERVVKSVFACLEGKQDYAEEFRMRHKDGSWRWILARGATNAPKGQKATRIIGAHTDITRQKTDEERLLASNKELEEFTYIASHDLRAPLVNMKGFANEIEFAFAAVKDFVMQYLPKKDRNEHEQQLYNAIHDDIPQSIHFIHHSVSKMERLTRAILELSRVGRRRLEFEPLHTRSIVENCVKSLSHQISTKNMVINIGTMPDITADAVAIEQVFMNILNNAVKYTDPEKTGLVDISGIRSVWETTFRIHDNGRGIRKDDMHKVFEIFKRAGNNTEIPGEGMGMAYVQAIIRRHGGTIWCESELGVGTTFFFSIPHHIEKGPDNASIRTL